MRFTIQADGFTIDGIHLQCSAVKGTQIKDLLELWVNKITTLDDGESAYIPLREDRIDVFPSIYCLKATKQGGKIRLEIEEAVDPLYDAKDQDPWLWAFSASEATLLSSIWIHASLLAEYNMQECVDELLRACSQSSRIG